MRIKYSTALTVLACMLLATSARAQFVAVETADGTSTAGLVVEDNGVFSSGGPSNVNSFLYLNSFHKTQGTSDGSFIVAFSSTEFTGQLSGNIVDANSALDATTTLYFTDLFAANYAVQNNVLGVGATTTFTYDLKDLTSNTTLYSTTSGGSPNGLLTVGHNYSLITEIKFASGATAPPPSSSVIGDFGLAFTQPTPEPNAALLSSIFALPWLVKRKRR